MVAALQTLYEWDAVGHPLEDCLERQLSERVDDALVAERVRALVDGVAENITEIDTVIQAAATSWPIQQMAVVDRNILRLAVYQLRFAGQAHVGPVINEAVELAKTYGSESSGRFVNGVLGSISLTTAR
jgi:transcription antitermination protein NusB